MGYGASKGTQRNVDDRHYRCHERLLIRNVVVSMKLEICMKVESEENLALLFKNIKIILIKSCTKATLTNVLSHFDESFL